MRPRLSRYDTTASNVEAKAFLQRFRGISSDNILDELANMGWDSERFAREIKQLYEATGSERNRLRLLELYFKIVQQKEGQKVIVDDISGQNDEDLKLIVAEMAHELSGGSESMLDGLLKLAEVEAPDVGNKSPAVRKGRSGDPPAEPRSYPALPAPARRQTDAPVARPHKGHKRGQSKR